MIYRSILNSPSLRGFYPVVFPGGIVCEEPAHPKDS